MQFGKLGPVGCESNREDPDPSPGTGCSTCHLDVLSRDSCRRSAAGLDVHLMRTGVYPQAISPGSLPVDGLPSRHTSDLAGSLLKPEGRGKRCMDVSMCVFVPAKTQ